jgi:hypothetical protein
MRQAPPLIPINNPSPRTAKKPALRLSKQLPAGFRTKTSLLRLETQDTSHLNWHEGEIDRLKRAASGRNEVAGQTQSPNLRE